MKKKLKDKLKAKAVIADSDRISLQGVIDSSPYVIQVFKAERDKEGKITDFTWVLNNRKGIDQNGDVIGKSLLQQNPGVVPTGIFQKMKEVTESGLPYTQEIHYNHEQFDGWFRQSLVKLNDGVVMNTEDITAQKKAEQELKVSQDLVKTVFDVTTNPIAYHKAVRDHEGKIIDFEFKLENREARKYAQADRTGQRYSDVYPGIKETKVFAHYCHVVETGSNLDTEVQIELQGVKRWFHLMAVKLGDGLVATAPDVTETKRAALEILRLKEEIAQNATDRYRSLFNSIDQGFCVIEVLFDQQDQVYDYRFLEANRSFEEQTGLVDAVGKTMRQLAPGHEQFWFDTYARIARTGQPAPLRARCKGP